MVMVQQISVEEAIKLENTIFIDTRTPAEFAEAHIPDAVNIPIFSNEERALIGLTYTKESKNKAIDIGVRLFSQKIPAIAEEMKKYRGKTVIFNCWRGGMRSKVIAGLFSGLGYTTMQLNGGHKAFRKYVLEQMNKYQINSRLVVLYGLTGTGKTELLGQFSNMIDLEDLAQHRNSRLGMVGLVPRSQKMFEALLLQRLTALQKESFIFIEGESRKLGIVLLPEFLFTAMKKGINIKIELAMEMRCKRLSAEYFDTVEKIAEVRRIVLTMTQVLSHKIVDGIIAAIDLKNYEEAVRLLLVHFYDPLYNHTIENVTYDLKVENSDVGKAGDLIKQFILTK